MQMLSRYFTPFALVLILSAVHFGEPEKDTTKIAISILIGDVVANWWIGKNQYRWVAWAGRFRQIQVWLNLVVAIPLFYLLYPYWGPMWLVFVLAPTAAALTTSKLETVSCSLAAAGSMIGIIYARQPLEGPFLGMVLSHAAFIVIFSLFVHGLAQTALRLRDFGANR
ncbi:MAG: hypothetical protein Q7J64_04330 [Elusimicrobiota bacterium]|nr:hypothetical protein [Elusimicrobiota bacterium]